MGDDDSVNRAAMGAIGSEMSRRLVEEFVEDAHSRLKVMSNIVCSLFDENAFWPDYEFELRCQLHNLKGTAGSFGFPEITLMCHELEEQVQGSFGGDVRLLHHMLVCFSEMIGMLDGKCRMDETCMTAAAGPVDTLTGDIARAGQSGLSRLLYCSVSNQDVDMDVAAMLGKARQFNAGHLITGALWFNGFHFVQVLEGERRCVCDLFYRIRQDPRHMDVDLLSLNSAKSRLFHQWSMGYRGDTPSNHRRLFRIMDNIEIEPRTLSSEGLIRFLYRMVAMDSLDKREKP